MNDDHLSTELTREMDHIRWKVRPKVYFYASLMLERYEAQGDHQFTKYAETLGMQYIVDHCVMWYTLNKDKYCLFEEACETIDRKVVEYYRELKEDFDGKSKS